MFRGFTTLNYYVDDLPAAIGWYSDVLGVQPYFVLPNAETPAYAEFRVGDHLDELGLIDANYRPAQLSAGTGGAVMHWHVDDIPSALDRLESRGATRVEGPVDRGHGFVTAMVLDPFGNIIGLMHSPHYLAQLRN